MAGARCVLAASLQEPALGRLKLGVSKIPMPLSPAFYRIFCVWLGFYTRSSLSLEAALLDIAVFQEFCIKPAHNILLFNHDRARTQPSCARRHAAVVLLVFTAAPRSIVNSRTSGYVTDIPFHDQTCPSKNLYREAFQFGGWAFV